MNPNAPMRKEWPDIVDELKVAIHNTEVSLELLKAQLKRAEEHSRGQK